LDLEKSGALSLLSRMRHAVHVRLTLVQLS
jgi:hypothetical protein